MENHDVEVEGDGVEGDNDHSNAIAMEVNNTCNIYIIIIIQTALFFWRVRNDRACV